MIQVDKRRTNFDGLDNYLAAIRVPVVFRGLAKVGSPAAPCGSAAASAAISAAPALSCGPCPPLQHTHTHTILLSVALLPATHFKLACAAPHPPHVRQGTYFSNKELVVLQQPSSIALVANSPFGMQRLDYLLDDQVCR